MRQGIYNVAGNRALTEGVWELRLLGDTGSITAPGQFINIKLEGFFLRRPISICDWSGEALTVVYKVVGKGTEVLSQMGAGEKLDVLCGLGNGFDISKCGGRTVVAGGGAGVPPMYGLAKALLRTGKSPTALLGFNTKKEIFYEEEFRALGVETVDFWELRDYTMETTAAHVEKLAHIIREFRPDLILTHSAYDAFNPDHNMVHQLVAKAYACASGAGFQDGFPVSPRQTPIFGFEPHCTEISSFTPTVYVDITDVIDIKQEAMRIFSTQPGMYASYMRKAEVRGGEAAGRGSRPGCKYAEAFSIYQPIAASGGFIW